MDNYQIIAASFQQTIEAAAMSVDALAGPIEEAAALMTRALLDDGKILACGNGSDSALAQLFAGTLLDRHERERPALPALALGGDAVSISAIARAGDAADIYSRQLRALGQAGDVLLYINSAGGDISMLRAVQAARERDMGVIALTSSYDDELATLLQAGDVELRINAPGRASIVELQLMVIHCFCALIDHGLFGGYYED